MIFERTDAQNGLYRVIMIGLVCLVVFLAISRQKAANALTEALAENSAKTEQILALEKALNTQNAAIHEIKIETDLAQARYEEAVMIASQKNEHLNTTINTLKTAKGTTCADAMPLIEAVISGG